MDARFLYTVLVLFAFSLTYMTAEIVDSVENGIPAKERNDLLANSEDTESGVQGIADEDLETGASQYRQYRTTYIPGYGGYGHYGGHRYYGGYRYPYYGGYGSWYGHGYGHGYGHRYGRGWKPYYYY